jgi:hypothetical protein
MAELGIPGGPWTLAALEEAYPLLRWRDPIPVTVLVKQGVIDGPAGPALVCRVCIANHGLKARDVLEGRVPLFADAAARAALGALDP